MRGCCLESLAWIPTHTIKKAMPIDTALLSTVSETDRVIFRRFCNRSKVDTDDLKQLPNKIPGVGGGGGANPAVTPKHAASAPASPASPVSPRRDDDHRPPASLFAKRLTQPPPRSPSPSPPPVYSPPKLMRASAEMRTFPQPPPLPPLPNPNQNFLTASVMPPPVPPLPPGFGSNHHPTATRITAAPAGLDAEERHRRQSGLLQLQKLEADLGVKLSREFSMEDSSEDIEFEIDFHENNASVRRGVSFMKFGLGAGMYGLEKLNDKVGPIADLTGLAGTTISSIDMYAAPMEKIYRKYWRKRMSNPMSELIFLIVATIAATHIGNKGGPLMKGMTKMFLNMMGNQNQNQANANVNASSAAPDMKASLFGSLFGGGGSNPLGDIMGGLFKGQQGMAPGFPSRVNLNTSNPPPQPQPPAPAPAPPAQHHHHNYYAAPAAPTGTPAPAPAAAPAPAPTPPPQAPAPAPAPPARSSATMATPLRPGSFFAKASPPPPAPPSQGHPIEGMFIFPLAGTPVLSGAMAAARRGNPDTFLSLPTVEEITDEEVEADPTPVVSVTAPPPTTPAATVINHRLFEDMINQAKAQTAEMELDLEAEADAGGN